MEVYWQDWQEVYYKVSTLAQSVALFKRVHGLLHSPEVWTWRRQSTGACAPCLQPTSICTWLTGHDVCAVFGRDRFSLLKRSGLALLPLPLSRRSLTMSGTSCSGCRAAPTCCCTRTRWRLPLRWRAFCTRFAAIVAWGWATAVARVAATWLDWRRRFALSTPALAAYTTWLLRACAAASRFACTARLAWPCASSRTLRVYCA